MTTRKAPPPEVAGVRHTTLDALTPDPHNTNKGTERGVGMLEHSLRQYGAGRSVLLDKHGVVIAGNKTVEAAASIGIRDVIVIPSNGRQLFAVQRTDLDLAHDPEARELSIVDNRVSEIGFALDAEALKAARDAGAELSPMYSDAELARIWKDDTLGAAPVAVEGGASRLVHRCPACGHEWSGSGDDDA